MLSTAMSRRRFLANLASFSAAAALPSWLGAQVPDRGRGPLNFVFILIDDLGWSDLSCYGSRFYETPNLDRLASQGVRFTNAYASCPVCSPTRAAILSGKHPARLNLTDWIPGRKQWPAAKLLVPRFEQQLPLAEVTIPEMLRPAGYRSASIGKWHLGGTDFYPEKQGFDLNIAGTERGSPRSYFGPWDLPNLTGGTADDQLDERLAEEAGGFLERNRDNPFFLYLPNFAVHQPLQARRAAIARYEAKAKPEEGQRHPVYAAMVESMDRGAGRVLKALDDLGIAGRTVVVFTSDNGGLIYEGSSKRPVTSNAPWRAGKGHLYEGGIRVPLIVRWPGVTPAGRECDVPVSSTDFFPTITEAAGNRRPRVTDGASLIPLLRNPGAGKRRPLFWHYPHYSNQGGVPGGAVRDGEWKLIEFYEDGRLELYHLPSDPGERVNLARRNQRKAAELHRMLQRWRESVGARVPLANPAYDPEKANQGLTGAEPPTPPV